MTQRSDDAVLADAAAQVEAVGLRGCECEAAGRHAEALVHYREAATRSEALARLHRGALRRGRDVPQGAPPGQLLRISLDNMARTLEGLGRPAEALPIRRRVVRGLSRAADVDSLEGAGELADARARLARTLELCGHPVTAIRVLKHALAAARRAVLAAHGLEVRVMVDLEQALASLLDRQDRPSEGLRAWGRALRLLETSATDPAALERCRHSIRVSRVLLGYPERTFDLDSAIAHSAPASPSSAVAVSDPKRVARRRGASLTAALAMRDEAARLRHAGQVESAEASYRAAIAAFKALAASDLPLARPLAGTLQVDLAFMLAGSGRNLEAIDEWRRGGSALARARQAGQVVYIGRELLALCGMLATRQGLAQAVARAAGRGARRALMHAVDRVEGVLSEALDAPFASALGDDDAIAALTNAMLLCRQLGYLGASPVAPEVRASAARKAFSLWLELASRVLGECSPETLRKDAVALHDGMHETLHRRLAVPGPDLAADVARWVLHTQALRAQRDLIVASDDAEAHVLAELWRRIDELDRDALGQPPGLGEDAATLRQALARDRDRLRDSLVSKGRLPPALVPSLDTVTSALDPEEQLWLPVPLAGGPGGRTPPGATRRLLLVTIAAAGTIALHPFELAAESGPQAWMDGLEALCALLRGGARGAMRDRAGAVGTTPAQDADAAGLAAALFRAPRLLAPVLASLAQREPVRRVHLVPIGEAHALPWSNALRDARVPGSPALRQHASVAAWLRSRLTPAGRADLPLVRPAIAFDDASSAGRSRALPLARLEAALSWQLWVDRGAVEPALLPDPAHANDRWPPALAAGQTVSALIGIGHGGVPDGNWARAGLWMPGWPAPHGEAARERHLDATCLPGLPHVQRLFMSCCILGRTTDRLGEPLGLLALAAGFGVQTAIGSLVPVDDAHALLLSLSFQWLAAQGGRLVDWVEAFHALRGDLHRGRWPEGFAPWLRTALDKRLAHSGVFAGADGEARVASLAALRRTMSEPPSAALAAASDWFVALG